MIERIVYNDDSVTIYNSASEYSRVLMIVVCEQIRDNYKCPKCVYLRSIHSLRREWEAHNLLYLLGYKKERTRDVDFNDETIIRKIGYELLGFVYSLFVRPYYILVKKA